LVDEDLLQALRLDARKGSRAGPQGQEERRNQLAVAQLSSGIVVTPSEPGDVTLGEKAVEVELVSVIFCPCLSLYENIA
jgi:hypothetical protein